MATFDELRAAWKDQAVPEKLPPELTQANPWATTAEALSDTLFRQYQRGLAATQRLETLLAFMSAAATQAQNDANTAKSKLAAIAGLGADTGSISNPPTQAEVTRIRDHMNMIIAKAGA